MENIGLSRKELAIAIRRSRRVERHSMKTEINGARTRSLEDYYAHLQGLEAMLDYLRHRTIRNVVDLGAGIAQAIAALSLAEGEQGLHFLGTGLLWDPAIAAVDYRITPAEIMRGFKPVSVGGFLSVYGPFEHSHYLDRVLAKTHELLVPQGLIKLCVIRTIVKENYPLHEAHAITCEKIEHFFRSQKYDLAMCDWDRATVGRSGINRIFLAIKEPTSVSLAASIMDADRGSLPAGIYQRLSSWR